MKTHAAKKEKNSDPEELVSGSNSKAVKTPQAPLQTNLNQVTKNFSIFFVVITSSSDQTNNFIKGASQILTPPINLLPRATDRDATGFYNCSLCTKVLNIFNQPSHESIIKLCNFYFSIHADFQQFTQF